MNKDDRWKRLFEGVDMDKHRAFIQSVCIVCAIEEYMKKGNITREELSKKSGISVVKLNHLYMGDTLFDMVTLSKILYALNIRLKIAVEELPKEIAND